MIKARSNQKDPKAMASILCQKCLKYGHFTYECQNDYAYKYRPSRTLVAKHPHLETDKQITENLPDDKVWDGDIRRTKNYVSRKQRDEEIIRKIQEQLSSESSDNQQSSSQSSSDSEQDSSDSSDSSNTSSDSSQSRSRSRSKDK